MNTKAKNEIMKTALARISAATVDWLDGGRDSEVLARAINVAESALKAVEE